MLQYERTPEFFESWHIIRNHLIKKYPALRHYDLEYERGHESKLLNRVLLLTGISEKRLEKEIYEALSNFEKSKAKMQYY